MNPNEMSEQDHRNVTPLDLLNANNYTTREIRDSRLDICRQCDHLIKITHTCKTCGCFMSMKTWLYQAQCPIGLWGAVEADNS